MAGTRNDVIYDQAKLLAEEARRGEPHVVQIFWFPDDAEVRLIETLDNCPRWLGGQVEPFYFNPSPEDDLPSPSAMAAIRPDEFGKLALPEGWCAWEDAVEIGGDE